MITTVLALPIGNALRLFIAPPAGATRWRILRMGVDNFSGPDDPNALQVYEGDEKYVLDTLALKNEIAQFYRIYDWIDGDWVDSGVSISGTPVATYEDASTDAQSIVRQRLEEGLAVEVSRGALFNDLGYVQVFSAPPQISDDLKFPLVTVELSNEQPSERGIGEDITGDELDPAGGWRDSEGWLASVSLQVTGWSLNPDERIELRKALRRLIVANLPVFDAAGMLEITFSTQDIDFLNGEFGAPLYQCMGTFSCLAPVVVRSHLESVSDVEVTNIQP